MSFRKQRCKILKRSIFFWGGGNVKLKRSHTNKFTVFELCEPHLFFLLCLLVLMSTWFLFAPLDPKHTKATFRYVAVFRLEQLHRCNLGSRSLSKDYTNTELIKDIIKRTSTLLQLITKPDLSNCCTMIIMVIMTLKDLSSFGKYCTLPS